MIIKERNKEVLDTTFKLVKLIKRVKKSDHKRKNHPATKSFQALRIATNQELKSLKIINDFRKNIVTWSKVSSNNISFFRR